MKPFNTGFTLVELMVTIVVMAVALTLGIPEMQRIIQGNRVSSESTSIMAALRLAKSEAIKRGAEVEICASSDGSACDGAGWADGWIVRVPGDDELLIREEQRAASVSFANSTATNIVFNGEGFPTPPQLNTISVAAVDPDLGIPVREIEVAVSGTITVTESNEETP